eukprot:2884307-Rhodomonas_salina.4
MGGVGTIVRRRRKGKTILRQGEGDGVRGEGRLGPAPPLAASASQPYTSACTAPPEDGPRCSHRFRCNRPHTFRKCRTCWVELLGCSQTLRVHENDECDGCWRMKV